MAQEQCPNCQKLVDQLLPVEPGLRVRLIDVAGIANPPESVCAECKAGLSEQMSQGAVLRAAEKRKQEQRRALWNSRVTHVKKGRNYMAKKMFSEAAVEYEKYIRILEIVYDAEPGNLKYADFKDAQGAKELTVVASVYWDLMLIYDSSTRYGTRLANASKKLTEFARFTPVFPDLIRRAGIYRKKAKNPNIFKEFVNVAQEDRPSCFIATAVFENSAAPEVIILRAYRDSVLKLSPLGRKWIAYYYSHSPNWVPWVQRSPKVKFLLKVLLKRLSSCIAFRLLVAKWVSSVHR